jgi:hypothetical protein
VRHGAPTTSNTKSMNPMSSILPNEAGVDLRFRLLAAAAWLYRLTEALGRGVRNALNCRDDAHFERVDLLRRREFDQGSG